MTTRDQIALDIYIRFATERERMSPMEEDAMIAYRDADIFLEEMKRQNPAPEAPEAPIPTPAMKERKTVPPVVGKRFYMRNGDTVVIEHIAREHTSFHLPNGKHNLNPQYDLIDECPF